MAAFRFRLATVLRVRNVVRDERRRALAAALEQRDALEREKAGLVATRDATLASMREAQARIPLPMGVIVDHRYHAGWLSSEMARTDREIEAATLQVEKCRQNLIRADQEVKALENLQERDLREYETAELAREARSLEDAWRPRGDDE